MNQDRLAQAWPHIRSAVEILLYGTELYAKSQEPLPTENLNADQREAWIRLIGKLMDAEEAGAFDPKNATVRQIRDILDKAVPAKPLPANEIPGGVPHGTWSRIARELKVSPTLVRRVAIGDGVSKRVAEALVRHGIKPVQKVRIGGVA
jgi:hypothetical protein